MDTLIYVYKELNITSEIPTSIKTYGNNPFEIFELIFNYIKEDPLKFKHVVDKIINDAGFRIRLPDHIRCAISKLYPDDEELALCLLIDTTSYYKLKYRPTGRYDSDHEEIEIPYYSLIFHCPEYYFSIYFSRYYNSNETIRKALIKYNIYENDINSDKLMAIYKQRNKNN